MDIIFILLRKYSKVRVERDVQQRFHHIADVVGDAGVTSDGRTIHCCGFVQGSLSLYL